MTRRHLEPAGAGEGGTMRAPRTLLNVGRFRLLQLRDRYGECVGDGPLDERCPIRGDRAVEILNEVELALAAKDGGR